MKKEMCNFYICFTLLSLLFSAQALHARDPIDVSLNYYEKNLLPKRTAQRPTTSGHTIDESEAVHVFYVDQDNPNASDQNPGTKEKPFKTIQYPVKYLNEKRIPAKIIIKPGIYRENILLANKNMPWDEPLLIIEAEKKGTVFVTGSDVFKGWKKEKSKDCYVAEWPYTWGFSALEYEKKLNYAKPGRRKELVSIKDNLLKQHLSLPDLSAGSFFIDEELGKIYVKPPAGVAIHNVDVEVGVRSKIFEIKRRANFIVRGINIKNTMGTMHDSAFRLANVSNFLIEDCTIYNNATTGILLILAENGTLRGVSSLNNGGNGMDMYIAQSLRVEDSAFSYNCWRSNQARIWHYFPAGSKLCRIRNMEFQRNKFIGNLARGFWIDINGEFNLFKENLVMDNTSYGVYIETSHGPTFIQDNMITGNEYGVMFAESWLTELSGNTIFQNRVSQVGIRAMDNRRSQDVKPRDFFYAQETRGSHLTFVYQPMKLTMKNNILFSDIQEADLYRHDTALGKKGFIGHIKTYTGQNNLFYHAKKGKAFFPAPVHSALNLQEWQAATGQDKGSRWKDPELYSVDIRYKENELAVTINNPKSKVTQVALYGAALKNYKEKDLYYIDWVDIKKISIKKSPPYTFSLEKIKGRFMLFAQVDTADNMVMHSKRIAVTR